MQSFAAGCSATSASRRGFCCRPRRRRAAARLRLDHGAIAALLVPAPTAAIVATLRHVLARHNPLEESADGLYAICDALLAPRAAAAIAEMKAYPEVRVSPHNDGPNVLPALERALERAGYRLIG